jgi:hypothetical protein
MLIAATVAVALLVFGRELSEVLHIGWLDSSRARETSHEMLAEHFAAVVGVPAAALLSAVLMTILRNLGPIQLEAAGIKFKGASGPIILWVFCFVTLALCVKLLW